MSVLKRKCPKCGVRKSIKKFSNDRTQINGLSCWCKKCTAENGKKLYYNKKKRGICVTCTKSAIKNRTQCLDCAEKGKRHRKRRYKELKEEIVRFYCKGTPRCMCPRCPITAIELLTIDHIHGGGRSLILKRSKRSTGVSTAAGSALYNWIVTHNFPAGFQILCGSCNMSKRTNKRCPRAGAKH